MIKFSITYYYYFVNKKKCPKDVLSIFAYKSIGSIACLSQIAHITGNEKAWMLLSGNLFRIGKPKLRL
jgi:hypothetical protein